MVGLYQCCDIDVFFASVRLLSVLWWSVLASYCIDCCIDETIGCPVRIGRLLVVLEAHLCSVLYVFSGGCAGFCLGFALAGLVDVCRFSIL